jgi:hypothetical protein
VLYSKRLLSADALQNAFGVLSEDVAYDNRRFLHDVRHLGTDESVLSPTKALRYTKAECAGF